MRPSSLRVAIVVLALVSALGWRSASACSTEPMTVEWLADHAAQVLVCDVSNVRSYWVEEPRRIESEVTLRDIVYLKGRPDEARSTTTLIFPGGTVGETTMRLCCAPTIESGQRWVVFLQAEYRTFPSAGMGQGMFRIVQEAFGELPRVHSSSGVPIVAIGEMGVPIAGGPIQEQARAQPVGRRGAIRVRAIGDPGRGAEDPEPRAMTLDAFVERITPVLQASRVFDDPRPAGRRIEPDLVPVPLVREAGLTDEKRPRDKSARSTGREALARPPKRQVPQRGGGGR